MSQKAVIIDMMKSVDEIASKIWPVVKYLTHFGEILTFTFDLDLWSLVKVIVTWVIECALSFFTSDILVIFLDYLCIYENDTNV